MRRWLILFIMVLVVSGGVTAQEKASPFTPEMVARFGRGSAITAAWSPDGSHLAVAASIGVWVYDAADWDAEPSLFPTTYRATWVEFSPAGGLLAVGLGDGTAQAFDVVTGQMLDRIIGGPVPERGAMANFNVPARYATFVAEDVSSGQDTFGIVVSQTTVTDSDGTPLRLKVVVSMPEGEEQREPVLTSPDGALRVVIEPDSVTLVDAADDEALAELPGYTMPVVDALISADGTTLIVEHSGGEMREYDLSSGELRYANFPDPDSKFPRPPVLDTDLNFSRMAMATESGGIVLTDVRAETERTLEGRGDARVTSLAFSPNGQRLAAGFSDGVLVVYDAGSGRFLRQHYAHFGHVEGVGWILGGAVIVTAGEDGGMRLLASTTLEELSSLTPHADVVKALTVSPTDDVLFASASLDGTVILWRLGLQVQR